MGLIAAILLSQTAAAAQPPAPPPASQRVTAMARVEILAVGRAGPAQAADSQRRLVRRESGVAMTIFE